MIDNDSVNKVIMCPYCRGDNTSGNKYCVKCGASLINENLQNNIDVQSQNGINAQQTGENKKNKKFGILIFFGMIATFLFLFSILYYVGFVLFCILVVLNFTYNGNYNPWAEIFRFIGLGFLVMVIFVLILFGMCMFAF